MPSGWFWHLVARSGVLVTGRIIRFDDSRGYGFIASDVNGEEDVFFHANESAGSRDSLVVGAKVAFEVVEGDRGLKAQGMRVLSTSQVAAAPERRPAVAPLAGSDSDDMVEVLTEGELRTVLTEALLVDVPTITASQLLAVRECVMALAIKHEWID